MSQFLNVRVTLGEAKALHRLASLAAENAREPEDLKRHLSRMRFWAGQIAATQPKAESPIPCNLHSYTHNVAGDLIRLDSPAS